MKKKTFQIYQFLGLCFILSGASFAVASFCYAVPTGRIVDTTPPVLSNLNPQNENYPAGTDSVAVSLNTDENATCKYSDTAGTAYGNMAGSFQNTGGTSHSFSAEGIENGNSYTYYVKCRDASANANMSDQVLSFSVSSSEYLPTLAVGNTKTYLLSPGTTISLKSKYVVFRGKMTGLGNGKVQVFQDGTLERESRIKKRGKWRVRVVEKSKNTTYVYQFRYFDQNDQNTETSRNYTVIIDRTKPEFSYLPRKMTKYPGDTISWEVSDNDQVKYYEYKFRGRSRKTNDNHFVLPASIGKGTYSLKVKAFDRAENFAERKVKVEVR